LIPSPIPIKAPQRVRYTTLLCLGLILLVFAVFGQSLGHEFINYDDNEFITTNPHLLSGLTWDNVRWALVAGTGGAMTDTDYWRPVSILSQMVDVQFFGLHAGSHHAVNVLLQALNSVLLFLILRSMTGSLWRSAFVAALFAIHPLHVESVAWISERKDLLSGFFFLLTLGSYVRYARHSFCWRSYLLVLLLCALAMGSKPMVVTLPFVLILLDFWPLHRLGRASWQKLLLEKIPLFAMALFVAVITLHAPGGRNEGIMDQLPWSWRLGNAVVAYATYLWQLIWPFNLSAFYPHPGKDLSPWSLALSAFVLLLISALVLWQRRRGYMMVGWLWYLGMLLPVIGIVQSGEQAHADRYTYLPLIGIFIMIAWALNDWVGDHPKKRILLGTTLALLLIPLSCLSFKQTSYWRDSISLMSHAAECTDNNIHAHDNLGDAYLKNGNVDEALTEYQISLNRRPGYAYAECNLGCALLNKGLPKEAILHFQKALSTNADYAVAHHNLGEALREQGLFDEAIAHLSRALELNPGLPKAETQLGAALLQKGDPTGALVHYERALRINPNFPETHNIVGSILLQQAKEREALTEFQFALQADPSNFTYANNTAWLLGAARDKSLRDGPIAIQLARKAVEQSGGQPAALRTLAAAYAQAGLYQEAIDTCDQAIKGAVSQGNTNLAETLRKDRSIYLRSTPLP